VVVVVVVEWFVSRAYLKRIYFLTPDFQTYLLFIRIRDVVW